MSRFTTRVELNDAAAKDYENLHAAMEQEGFTRTITSDEGTTYWLPTAEYNRIGELTREQVLKSAKRAAASTGKIAKILVTEAGGRRWEGLEKML